MPSLPPLQGSLNLLLVVSVTNTSYAALLAGSVPLLLFDGFHDGLHDGFYDGLHAVLLDGWHYSSFVGSLIISACR